MKTIGIVAVVNGEELSQIEAAGRIVHEEVVVDNFDDGEDLLFTIVISPILYDFVVHLFYGWEDAVSRAEEGGKCNEHRESE